MASLDKIGLLLSDDKVILVESNRDQLQKLIALPLISSEVPVKEEGNYAEINEEIQIVALFQKILRENKIIPGPVCVSIPTKELFLRSFVIPFMPASEINNVVFFEAKKYVPFDLKLLDYAYKAIPFVENKQKRLRIVFYGVRKQTLEKYDRILKQLECKPFVYEPALVSLSKQLIANKHLRADQNMVVVYVHGNHGQIVFYEKGISFFFRDFPLSVENVSDPRTAPEEVRLQLLREIRKSFEYYNRQFSREKIKEILVISTVLDKDLVNSFAEELAVKAKMIESVVTVGGQGYVDMETISVCGSCLSNKAVSFNFLDSKASNQKQENPRILPWYVTEFFNWSFVEFIPAIQAAIVCGLVLAGIFTFTSLNLEDLRKQNSSLVTRQGKFSTLSAEEITREIEKNQQTLKNYQVAMAPSRISFLMVAITKALPEGVWLNSIRIRYNIVNRPILDIEGTVFLKKGPGTEFKSVNEFLSRLKASSELSNVKFVVNRMDRQNTGEFSTVVFSISGT